MTLSVIFIGAGIASIVWLSEYSTFLFLSLGGISLGLAIILFIMNSFVKGANPGSRKNKWLKTMLVIAAILTTACAIVGATTIMLRVIGLL